MGLWLACLIYLFIRACVCVQCVLLGIYVCIHGSSCKSFCFCLPYHVLKRGLWIENLSFSANLAECWVLRFFQFGQWGGSVLSRHAAMPNDLSLSSESSHMVAGEIHLPQGVPWALNASHGVHPPKQANTCKTIKNNTHMFTHPPWMGVKAHVVKPGSFVLIFIYVFVCVNVLPMCIYVHQSHVVPAEAREGICVSSFSLVLSLLWHSSVWCLCCCLKVILTTKL